jgi:uncharacterized protein (TIGR03437 family)
VSASHPGCRGEILMVKAAGLGATSPDVAAGQPFPADPLAPVVCRVGVRLNGERAETVNAIGWPHEVDAYRVDFRVPQRMTPGIVKLELSVREVSAPAIDLPLR